MVWSGLTVMLPDSSSEKCHCPRAFFVIGHRGHSDKAPENTLPAFELAAETTGFVQFDLAMTLDGRLITIHDDYVDRTTNGHGVVCRMDYAEILKLDAGEWFDKKFVHTRIPTLEQTFQALGNHSRYLINIRKREGCGLISREVMIQSTVNTVKRFGVQHKVVFEVDEVQSVQDLKHQLPSVLVLASINVLYTLAPLTTMWEFVDSSNADGLSAHYLMPLLKSSLLVEAHARHLKVFIHTVDSMYVSRWLECLGVDALISNSPEKLMQVSKCPIAGRNSDSNLPYATRTRSPWL